MPSRVTIIIKNLHDISDQTVQGVNLLDIGTSSIFQVGRYDVYGINRQDTRDLDTLFTCRDSCNTLGVARITFQIDQLASGGQRVSHGLTFSVNGQLLINS